jgi:serine protease Do
MNFSTKYQISALIAFLAAGMSLPFCRAQTITIPNILQLNSSGAYLGIQMDDVTAANMSKYKLSSERGAIVRSVMKGSPAESANLREDDVILEFGGYQVWSSMQLSRLVQETPVGRKADLVVSRDGQRIKLTVQLENRYGRRSENRVEPFPRDFYGPGGRSFQFQFPYPPNENLPAPDVRKQRLGVTLQPLTDQLGEFLGVPDRKGALVVSVAADSPSAGKLKSGDVIIAADGSNIDNPEDLIQWVHNKAEGTITLKIIRDKREATVVINLPTDRNQRGYKL